MRKTSVALAVVLLFALVVAGCARNDTTITTKVKAKMALDDAVRGQQIEVTTKDRVVTLTGNIDSEAAKEKALEIARSTEGVEGVSDMISVRTVAGTGEAPDSDRRLGVKIDDAGITMRVKSQLLDDPNVKGLKIDVDTREGVVYLTGDVRSDAERNRAISIARATEGVRDVQANLRVS